MRLHTTGDLHMRLVDDPSASDCHFNRRAIQANPGFLLTAIIYDPKLNSKSRVKGEFSVAPLVVILAALS